MINKPRNGKRAINIFVNDNINTQYVDTGIFQKIVELFKEEGYTFKVDRKLKMIYVKYLDKNGRYKKKYVKGGKINGKNIF